MWKLPAAQVSLKGQDEFSAPLLIVQAFENQFLLLPIACSWQIIQGYLLHQFIKHIYIPLFFAVIARSHSQAERIISSRDLFGIHSSNCSAFLLSEYMAIASPGLRRPIR